MNPEWKSKLKASVFKWGFELRLSKSMLCYLAAVAEDVAWDKHFNELAAGVDTFLATAHSLEKRGLIVRKEPKILASERGNSGWDWKALYRLTPAGETICTLIKQAGLWEEQTASIIRKRRRA